MLNDKINGFGEVLDLVDENDNIVGDVLRQDANSNPKLLHREVAILIYNEKNEILLQKRSMKKLVRPGCWTSAAAGHVEKGSDPLDVAHKELKEELGFDTDLVFVDKMLHKYSHECHFTYWYIGKYTGKEMVIDKDEADVVKFYSPKELDSLPCGMINGYNYEFFRRFWGGVFDEKLIKI